MTRGLDLRRGLLARQKLADLGLDENELSEVELQDGLDRATGVVPERQVSVSYSAGDEGTLQRAFDAYLGLRVDANEGKPVSRAFSAENPDGDTEAERALADAFEQVRFLPGASAVLPADPSPTVMPSPRQRLVHALALARRAGRS